MKHVQSLIFFTLTLSFSSLLFGAQQEDKKKPEHPEFPIYVEANKSSKIAEKATLNTPLVKIFEQKDWVKVGDRSNGTVGWVFQEDYKKALEASYQSKTQTVFINVHEKPGQAGDTLEIVAYKNGKKLDTKEAQALYKQLKKEQEERDRAMGQWLRSVNEFFNKAPRDAFWGAPVFERFSSTTGDMNAEKPDSTEKGKIQP